MLKIGREKNNVRFALQGALNLLHHSWVRSFNPLFTHLAGQVSWNSQPRRFCQVNSLFEVINPVLLPLSFRSWNVVGKRTQDLDLVPLLTESRDKDAHRHRRKRREIVQINNKNAPTTIVFEVMAFRCN